MSIHVSHLSFSYHRSRKVLDDLNFSVQSGTFVSLLGPNGTGKSTLLKCMLGLLRSYQGEIRVEGTEVKALSPSRLARLIAYIPQHSEGTFRYTVREIVLMGTTSLRSGLHSPGRKEDELVDEVLQRLSLTHLRDRVYTEISGGERQMVLIARALAQQARILFMDEPAANLDYGNQIRILDQIRALIPQGYTVIQSTHNPEQAFLYSDELIALHEGKIAAYGSPREVITPSLLRQLYGIEAEVKSLYGDRMRICIPASIVREYGTEGE